MNSKEIAKGIIIAFVIACGLILLAFFFYKIREVFVYLGLGAVVTLMGRPLTNFMHAKLKLSNTLSALFTIIIFIIILTGFISLVVPMIIDQADLLSNFNTPQMENYIKNQLDSINKFLLDKNIYILDDYLNADFQSHFNLDKVSSFFNNLIGRLSKILIGSFAVLFIAFFFLKDRNLINKIIYSIVPDKYDVRIKQAMDKTASLLSRYFLGIFLQVIVVSTLYYFGLLTMGIQTNSAIVIALLCGSMNIIPYLGPFVGYFIFMLFSTSDLLSQNLDFGHIILPKLTKLSILYLCIQLLDAFISQPVIYGRSVKSHPLEIFIVIMVGGLLGGVKGMIFAVPLYTIIRVFLKEFFSNVKWVQSITKGI